MSITNPFGNRICFTEQISSTPEPDKWPLKTCDNRPAMNIETDNAPLAAWAATATLPIDQILIHAQTDPNPQATIASCTTFAATIPEGTEALIITILTAPPPGLDHVAHHTANAAIWAFTQQAALAWAPRQIRVNAIGLNTSPAGPFEPTEQAGRTAGPAPAAPASLDDIVRTIQAIVSFRSMTGQIIRLGA